MELPTHQALNRWVKDLNHFYTSEPALYEQDYKPAGFRWIDANDADNSTFSYVRYGKDNDDFIVVVANFTPVPRMGHRIGVPEAGYYQELLNSDAEIYGGGNVGNMGGKHTEAVYSHGFNHSLNLNIPPLGIVLLKYKKA
jgi:1,4-alpha-glucan branching enzyme